MTEPKVRPWAIVAILFTTMLFIWGPVNASGVFFLPVVKHFGWSRALLSGLGATAPLAAGFISPLIGHLTDRIGSRRLMIVGAAMVALGYFALYRAESAATFLAAFIVVGVGVAAATIVPSALLITKLFGAQRGLALGTTFAGIPLGGTVITMVANYVVLRYGFRVGYLAMGAPIALVVIPLLLFVLRDPSAGGQSEQISNEAIERPAGLTGLEVREAFRTGSFWLIAIAEVMFATARVGIGVHLIPYLTGIGYTPTAAAGMFGAMFIFSAVGNFAVGRVVDRLGGRTTFMLVFIAAAVGLAALLEASDLAAIAAFMVVFGLVRETQPVVGPVTVSESLGTRRLGALLGILGFFTTVGFAVGPVIAGQIFDSTHSYSGALILFTVMALLSALAIRGVRPLIEEESSRRPTAVQPATADA